MSKGLWKRRYNKYSDEQRIGAVADYLIGKLGTKQIEAKWGVGQTTISYWVWQMRDHFKTRKPPRSKRTSWLGKIDKRNYLEPTRRAA